MTVSYYRNKIANTAMVLGDMEMFFISFAAMKIIYMRMAVTRLRYHGKQENQEGKDRKKSSGYPLLDIRRIFAKGNNFCRSLII
jgi:hypothetical protein